MQDPDRMTAIKEYPFDFSDLKQQKDCETTKTQPSNTMSNNNLGPGTNPPSILCSATDPDRKKSNERKVSIMTGDHDKEKNAQNESRNGRLSVHQAEGPSRRKSNLHNALASEIDGVWDKAHIEGRFKKYSTTSTIYSKKAHQEIEQIERSWWFACCQKCHQEEAGIPSWEPPNWQKFCPYPFCPTFRKTARLVTICLIGLLVWLNLWLIMGETAAPGGQLFSLALLTIAAHLAGWIVLKITTLPALIGMLLLGVIFKNVGLVHFDEKYNVVVSYIRKIALTILLARAGMDLDPHAMKKHFLTVIKLSLIPWIFEFALFAVMVYFLLGLPWDWSFLVASVIAAVSPAVVVPCLMRLRQKGYGVSKGIPTLVLAVSGIDDASSVAVFGIVFSIMFSSTSLTISIIQGPLSIVVGILFGVILGYFVKYVPERNDGFLVPLRVLFLLFGGIGSMLGFEEIGWGGAGPLAVITFAFIACKNWSDLGWEHEDNPVVTAFEIFWMFFEPMLFSVTGAQVVISELPGHLVLVGGGSLIVCVILRVLLTSLCAVRSNLNTKEKFFVGLSWMAKATVQAALGPVALDEVRKLEANGHATPEMRNFAEITVTLCVLSIVLTAPIGAIVITLTGPRLLSKTTKPPMLEETLSRTQSWRRSNRPSIRDISIIDEEEVVERDAEVTHSRPESPVTPLPRDAVIVLPPITTQPNNHTTNHTS